MWQLLFVLFVFGHLGRCAKPNILFILTDDQDWHMESVDHMQYLKVNHPYHFDGFFAMLTAESL